MFLGTFIETGMCLIGGEKYFKAQFQEAHVPSNENQDNLKYQLVFKKTEMFRISFACKLYL